MGSAKDSTYLDVIKALNRQYSSREGWEVEWKPIYGDIQPECLLWRQKAGMTQRVLVGVRMEKEVSQKAVEQLIEQARSLAQKNLPVDRKVLVVPSGAETSRVPDGIDIVTLDSYRILGDRIAWAKGLERSRFIESELQRRGV
ncbi:MAG: hypothetical protein KO206_01960 [Methanomicrobiaceae archaeon]|uniref:Uncharacterized protein n=1 Tax=hydrocarbon metagenome TaxID=938273 RepID=A0A0W8FJ85_9ZZZZ|nr:hypothetical protein [Methanomicrobiaceae archaeon]MDD5418969.1 hypothetical protein [Methanomicrobiaceae archaeon]